MASFLRPKGGGEGGADSAPSKSPLVTLTLETELSIQLRF